MESDAVQRVAVVGAGVAGVSVGRLLLAEGFECTLFERGEELGGVWAAGYANFGAQVQRELYEFPDWPLPAGTADFTPGPILRRYVEDYARHFGVLPHVRLRTTVIDIRERVGGAPGWTVVTEHDGQRAEEDFALVVVATGLYSSRPHLPDFTGRERFSGDVIHISEFDSSERVAGKRVAIVGYGKSATDAAVESAAVAAETTIVFRDAHWPVPRKLLGILPFKWAMLSRLTSTLLPPYYRPTRAERVVHSVGKPLVWLWWRLVELLLIGQCRLSSRFGTRLSLVPRHPVEVDTFGEAVMLPRPEFYPLLRNGGIEPQWTGIAEYTPSGITLENGRQLDVDVVILATGWETDHSFLPESVRASSAFSEDGVYLYRQMAHPNAPNLFFVGNASTIASILTYSLQARWLADLLRDRHSLPAKEEMLHEIEELKAWKRHWMPASRGRGARLLLHMLHYHDQLLLDIGLDPRRKKGPFAPFKEVFAPYEPGDYAATLSGEGAGQRS